VRAPHVVTALEGLRAALPGVRIDTVLDDDPRVAAAAAAAADVAIVVAGYTAADEGEFADPSAMFAPELARLFPPPPEGAGDMAISVAGSDAFGLGGDRERLTLREVDEEIVRAVAAANPRTVVAIVAAGAVLTEGWRNEVPAVLMAWYSGMEGGHALADVLLGTAGASGRLPFSIPTSEDHLPFFDRNATAITYDRFHGQRLLDRLGVQAAYPLGFGLSYTSFTLARPEARRYDAETGSVDVDVTNTGDRDGRHVVQVYGTVGEDVAAAIAAGERHLLGFAPVQVGAGETVRVTVPVSLRPLAAWDGARQTTSTPRGSIQLVVGAHATDAAALSVTLPDA